MDKVHNTVQETVTKNIPKGEKKMQEGKVVVWGGFLINAEAFIINKRFFLI